MKDIFLLGAIEQNLFFVIYFIIAFIGIYPLHITNPPVFSIIYIIFIGIMLIFILRENIYTTIAIIIEKICRTGWEELESCIIKKNYMNYELDGKLVSST